MDISFIKKSFNYIYIFLKLIIATTTTKTSAVYLLFFVHIIMTD